MSITTDLKYLKQTYVDLFITSEESYFFGSRFYTQKETLKQNLIEKCVPVYLQLLLMTKREADG